MILLTIASWIVPAAKRAEWLAEWRGELHHARRAGKGTQFAFGAFPDALWMRRNLGEPILTSPAFCLLALAVTAAIGCALSGSHANELYGGAPRLYRILKGERLPGDAYYRPARLSGRTLGLASSNFSSLTSGSKTLWWLPVKVDGWMVQDHAPMPDDVLLAADPHGRLAQKIPNSLLPAHVAILLVAICLVPLVAPVSLGEYPAGAGARFWLFLAGKFALLIPNVFWGTYALIAPIALVVHPHVLLVGYVLVFRWALKDQRRRCPVCLRMLEHPARIGQMSRSVFEWHGTELVCLKGHGLLEVREVATSSYACQRWVRLDQSWANLF